MTPDEIQKDHEAGTPGPWIASMYDPENEGGEYDTVLADAGFHGVSGLAYITHFWAGHAADCRRIARLPDLEEAYLALTAENVALKARVVELEDALEPFARRADTYDPPEDDDWVVDWYDSVDRPTLGNFRLARAALEKRHD